MSFFAMFGKQTNANRVETEPVDDGTTLRLCGAYGSPVRGSLHLVINNVFKLFDLHHPAVHQQNFGAAEISAASLPPYSYGTYRRARLSGSAGSSGCTEIAAQVVMA